MRRMDAVLWMSSIGCMVQTTVLWSAVLAQLSPSCNLPVTTDTYEVLHSLYKSTNGELWAVQPEIDGIPWNFSGYYSDVNSGADRPCRDRWEGLECVQDPADSTFCNIRGINLGYYSLTGYLTEDIGNLTSLEYLDLSVNHLVTTLPTTLGLLTNLQILAISNNWVFGTIPSQLGNLLGLSEMLLSTNRITQSLPDELFGLTNLSIVHLNDNGLTGTLSPSFSSLTNLTYLDLETNYFSGKLPTTFGLMTWIQDIFLSFNRISGSIPTCFGNMSALAKFEVINNHLTQALPAELGMLSKLNVLLLNENELSGPIPTTLFSCSVLQIVSLGSNLLSGTIPTEVGSAGVMLGLILELNSLTGTIPTQLGQMALLGVLFVDDNMLSGSIPPSVVERLPLMIDFQAGSNLLTGPLPTEISNWPFLEVLVVSINYFTSTLPETLSLEVLLVQVNGNFLSGQLHKLFGPDANHKFPAMLLLDISDNGFSGSFPASVFSMQLLRLTASSNCFSGELTCVLSNSSLQNVTQSPLQELDLEGLSSGIGCRNYVLPRTILENGGYYPNSYILGTIPSCFWTLPNLRELYLDGNGFTGSIVVDSNQSLIPKLVNLSLHSNELVGTIPSFLFEHEGFQLLDLASNRFHGTVGKQISQQMCSNSTQFNIAVNRLSGPLYPTQGCSWEKMTNQVLQGNLFTFPLSGIDGETSESALSYFGSYTLNIAMILASPIYMFAASLGVFSMWLRNRGGNFSVPGWLRQLVIWNWQVANILLPDEWIRIIWDRMKSVKHVLVKMVAILCCFVVLYATIKTSDQYVTHEDQYSWRVSAAYLHRCVPVVLLAGGIISSVAVVFDWNVAASYMLSKRKALCSCCKSSSISVNWRRMAKLICVLSANITVVGLANTGYLIALLNNSPQIQIIQISLSIFKLIWNSGFTVYAIKWTAYSERVFVNSLTIRFLIKLGNFVLVPCLVTSLVDSSCFLNLFQQKSDSLIYSPRCYGTVSVNKTADPPVSCLGTIDELVSPLSPPFIYSFQCSSAIISNYVPVVLYTCMISGLLIPLTIVLELLIVDRYENATFAKAFSFGKLWLPKILQPASVLCSSSRDSAESNIEDTFMLFPLEALLATELMYVTLLGSFGLAFPYLGGVIVCAAVFEGWAWSLAVGRYYSVFSQPLNSQAELVASASRIDGEYGQQSSFSSLSILWQAGCGPLSSQRSPADIRIGEDFAKLVKSVQSFSSLDIMLVIGVIFMFWGILFFDMVGDVYGTNAGLAAMFSIIIGGPFLIGGGVIVRMRLQRMFPAMASKVVAAFDLSLIANTSWNDNGIYKSKSAVVEFEGFYNVQSEFTSDKSSGSDASSANPMFQAL
jgi:Leucine-rich repeat (LRR) protein